MKLSPAAAIWGLAAQINAQPQIAFSSRLGKAADE
jgi:hypothetical protein